MKIILITHPTFLKSLSMPRFAKMLAEGMQARRHEVEIWAPKAKAIKIPIEGTLKKWLGYVDQYLFFPLEIKQKLKQSAPNTLFVFTDHALGPWVPLVADRPHVIHCHDFMAQWSALDKIKENPTSWTGKKYQAFIRKGYQKGKNFISVSAKTKQDLESFLITPPIVTELVYNGLNHLYTPIAQNIAREYVHKETSIDVGLGYILHVGGNQWYKNRTGVIDIYNAWRATSISNLPLLMVGPKANISLLEAYNKSPHKKDIYLLNGMSDAFVQHVYAGASVFLFPSLAEGFGWPIAEAMASGCPVITTNEAPMTEVAGEAAFLIPRKYEVHNGTNTWAIHASKVLDEVLNLSPLDRKKVVEAGLANASRFTAVEALDKIEAIYQKVLDTSALQ